MGSGLPKDLRPIAIVVVIGAIMSILDATIVNVALQTLRSDLDVSLATIQWVSTGYLLALARRDPADGLDGRALRAAARVDGRGRRRSCDQRAVRRGVVGRLADRLPRPAGAGRRDDHADRDDHARAGRGAEADGARDERRRRADAAGAGRSGRCSAGC